MPRCRRTTPRPVHGRDNEVRCHTASFKRKALSTNRVSPPRGTPALELVSTPGIGTTTRPLLCGIRAL
ncbi:hypothetical protein SAMN05443244_0618 [Terriglobus roseus]|uniref:Uncharacterized protein n=1 Tax=Terriglobus roseus TaxID=392734 RepID=A0A1H4JH38_9BACT|nr:hypothetical protein SAMN05443244_0618 [Terriglobus roseus]